MTDEALPFGSGGGFLLGDEAPAAAVLPDDLDREALAIGRTVDEFWRRDVAPALPALDAHDHGAARAVLKKAAALGLTAMQVPERFGGLALDFPSVIVAVEHLAEDPSYLGWHLGQSSLSTLPLVYYGTEEQQQRYLPRLLSVDLIGAFALTEPNAGSDALAATTRADLSADGRHYLLNGQKAWITNGGAADLFIVFAKVGGEAFTAFLVERDFGVRSGAEERKMGLAGTSTTPLYFDNVPVPVANLLGEVGRGHVIALTTLNCGRIEMGPIALRGAKKVLRLSTGYANERLAFGGPIARFGAIQEKLADMAVRIFAAESAVWRAVARVEADRQGRTGLSREAAEAAALEEHAIECAIVKVHASEMLDRVVDEGVQIHGGYGFHRDYAVERAYRDARVNRIFEGTNEINRLQIANLLVKRSRRGRLLLFEAMDRLADESPAADPFDGLLAAEAGLAARLRWLTLRALRLSLDVHREALPAEQEIATRLADLVIETFVLQATVARAETLVSRGRTDVVALTRLYAHAARPRITHAALEIAGALPPSAAVRDFARLVREWMDTAPINAIALRREIARRVTSSDLKFEIENPLRIDD